MSLFRKSQIVSAYAVVLAIVLLVTFAAKSNDKIVYVVFPPWLASEDVQRRIAASGGRFSTDSWHLASKVAVSDRTTLERLYSFGAALVLTATPTRLCTAGGVAAR